MFWSLRDFIDFGQNMRIIEHILEFWVDFTCPNSFSIFDYEYLLSMRKFWGLSSLVGRYGKTLQLAKSSTLYIYHSSKELDQTPINENWALVDFRGYVYAYIIKISIKSYKHFTPIQYILSMPNHYIMYKRGTYVWEKS